MLKLTASAALAGLVLAAQPGAAQAIGPDAAACRAGSGQNAVMVNVDGFKQRSGSLRVQLYSGDPSDFLEAGRYIRRVDLPVTPSGPMRICVAVPQPDRYAVAVRHDVDGNDRLGWSDGGGFSRNPRLSLPNPKPRHQDVVISVGAGVQPVNVVLNYRFGFSLRPVSGN